jgi:UDP-glucose 4-epimerase
VAEDGGPLTQAEAAVTGRVLVTGGAGFIGHHLVRSLLAAGADVLVLDDFSFGRRSHLEGLPREQHCRLWETDIRDATAFDAVPEFTPEVVFHLAAVHFIPYCNAHPKETLGINVLGTDRLLRALRDLPIRTLVFTSSAAVYGFADHRLAENDELQPVDVYGRSKWLGEELVQRFSEDRPDVRTISARLFNVYGLGETNAHLLPDLFAALRHGREIALGNTWPERDYVYVNDVVRALIHLAQGPAACEVFNVSTGVGNTVLDVVQTIEALSGQPITVRHDPKRVRAQDGHLVSSNGRILRQTGWRPAYDLKRGLYDLLQLEGLMATTEEGSVRR